MIPGAVFEVPTPPGVVIFAGPDRDYADSMRRIFKARGCGSHAVLLTRDNARVWALIVPNLLVLFTGIGADDITVEPWLVVMDPTAAPSRPWPPPGFAQDAINLTQAFMLRVTPAGRVQ